MAVVVTVTLTLIITLFLCAYFYLSRNYSYWKKRNVPYIKPLPFVGNILPVLLLKRSIGDVLADIYRRTTGPYVGIYTIDRPALLIRDRELFKNILIKDFDHFTDRSFDVNSDKEPILKFGLFIIKGEKWRRLRASVTPTFASGKIKNMFYIIHAITKRFDNYLSNYVGKQRTVNVLEMFGRYTTDVVVTTSFGVEGRSIEDENWEFNDITRGADNLGVLERITYQLATLTPWILKVFRLRIIDEYVYQRTRDGIWHTVEYRKQNGICKNDFLDLLLEIRNKTTLQRESDSNVDILDGDMFIAQCFTFLIAGSETSSFTMSMTLYELALNPDIQAKLRKEITTIIHKYNNELTYEGIQEMNYLKQCVNETLRKYPVLPYLDRVCTKDYPIPNTKHVIEKGTSVFLPIIAVQNDPSIYANPEKYDPDRFSDSNSGIDKMAFLPFGDGPRNCIGMRFGLLQVKMGLSCLLYKYQVEPCAETPIPIKFEINAIILALRSGLKLKLRAV